MGKGFNNYMSKKDFHPSAIWNLKRVYMAEEKLKMEKKKQDELRQQYDKEQEIINNKALLGDEKAKLGLAFMYDPPTGIRKEEKTADPATEPKFEWQRKYNAPREAWAKGDEAVQDQPFGIQVRNVRCVKCHTWGHINTDRECPLYNMSGSKEEPGFSTNPSDLIRELRKSKGDSTTVGSGKEKKERMDPRELMSDMRTEYGLTLKKHVLEQVHTDDALEKLGEKPDVKRKSTDQAPGASGGDPQNQLMFEFLKSLSDKERSKIFKKFFESETKDKKSKGEKKKKHRRRHDSEDDSDETSPSPPPKKHRKRHDSPDDPSPPPPRKHRKRRDSRDDRSPPPPKKQEKKRDSREEDASSKKYRRRHDSPEYSSPPPKKNRRRHDSPDDCPPSKRRYHK